MPTLEQQILNDLDSVFSDIDSKPSITVDHLYGSTHEDIECVFVIEENAGLSEFSDVQNSQPVIYLKTSAAGNIDQDSSFTFNSLTYYPVDIGPDKYGLIKITLSLDSSK